MSTTKRTIYDVFVSYVRSDVAVARKVSSQLRQKGFSVFFEPQPAGAQFTEEVRKAISESPVFVVVISPRSLKSPNIAVEVGAATAWSKSIFPVRHRVSPTALPTYLRSYKTFGSSELKALSRAVQTGLSPLTDDQLGALRKLYVQFGVPSDRLASYPASLESLTVKFNRAAKATLSSERLLQEILRQRKRGKWPTLKRIKRAKAGL